MKLVKEADDTDFKNRIDSIRWETVESRKVYDF